MQSLPTGWAEARARQYRMETKVSIAGVDYSESDVFSVSTRAALFSGNSVGIGGCVSKSLDLVIKPHGIIPRMAEIGVWVRPMAPSIHTNWLRKGIYYIDTRQTDRVSGVITIHGYDAMLKAERMYLEDSSSTETWPQSMQDVAYKIAARIGVEIDERSVIDPDFLIGYPAGYTMRELLSHIAVANGGNWIMTDAGKLRLVALCNAEDTSDLGVMMSGLDISPAFDPISRVTLMLDKETAYTAGDDTGRTLEASCPWATQDMADALLAKIGGYIYQPYSAQNAALDPALELGDTVILDRVHGCLASVMTVFDAKCSADIKAPADEEIDHEYPYETRANREINRKFAQTRSEIKQTIGSITLSVTNDEDGTSSMFELKLGELTLASGNISFDGYVTFTGLREGTTVIDGGCIQTGTILADLIKAGILQSKDGETFKLDLDKGTFSMRGSGRFQSADGSSYIVVEGDELVLYARDEDSGEYLDKLRMGYISGPSPSGESIIDYPYMMFGKSNTTEVGLIKKFVNGFWVGNSAPFNTSGNFEGVDGAAGIFVDTKTGKTYAVEGTKMRNIYSAADGEMSITTDDVAHGDNPLSECMPVCLTLEEYQALVAEGKDNPNTPYLIKKEA